MQHHAHSISKMSNIKLVTFIGYAGEKCFDHIERNPKIHKVTLPALSSSKGLVSTLWKGFYLCIQVMFILLSIPQYHLILIQNPPSLPIAFVSFLVSYFYNNSTIMIDWHNLGTISSLKMKYLSISFRIHHVQRSAEGLPCLGSHVPPVGIDSLFYQ